jgi:hypothetical protein
LHLGFEPDRTENRHVVRLGFFYGDGRSTHEIIAGKFFYLWLIDDNDRTIAGHDFLRPAYVFGQGQRRKKKERERSAKPGFHDGFLILIESE